VQQWNGTLKYNHPFSCKLHDTQDSKANSCVVTRLKYLCLFWNPVLWDLTKQHYQLPSTHFSVQLTIPIKLKLLGQYSFKSRQRSAVGHQVALNLQSAAEHTNSLAARDGPDTTVWITMTRVLGQTGLATRTSSRNWESNRASLQDTCFISIHWEASWSVLNSTKAKPRDAPTQQMDQHNVVLQPYSTQFLFSLLTGCYYYSWREKQELTWNYQQTLSTKE
jgi:hypothetical protein